MFTPLDVTTDLEASPWRDLATDSGLIHAQMTHIGLLPNGTANGRASVAIRATTDDGQTVILETTWRLFNIAAHALAASPLALSEV